MGSWLTAGTMFLIFPGGWHTYRPSPETGWSAYWIGFRGRVIDDRVGGGFFSGKSPVFRIGLSPLAVDVYREALAVAGREDPCYQQVLCGAVSLLMGLALNRSRREKPHQLARLVLTEQIYRACTINAGMKYHK